MRKPSSSPKIINFFDPVEPTAVVPGEKVPLNGFSWENQKLKKCSNFSNKEAIKKKFDGFRMVSLRSIQKRHNFGKQINVRRIK